jgi:histidine triad (HIT) family protein
MNQDTVFSKIINRELPASIVFEDDISIAFLDIEPVTKGHTLLVSKEGYPWMTDVPDEIIMGLFVRAKKIMNAMKSSLGVDYVQLNIVGTDVPHFHIHLIPRKLDGSKPAAMRHLESYTDEAEKNEITEKLKSALLA